MTLCFELNKSLSINKNPYVSTSTLGLCLPRKARKHSAPVTIGSGQRGNSLVSFEEGLLRRSSVLPQTLHHVSRPIDQSEMWLEHVGESRLMKLVPWADVIELECVGQSPRAAGSAKCIKSVASSLVLLPPPLLIESRVNKWRLKPMCVSVRVCKLSDG